MDISGGGASAIRRNWLVWICMEGLLGGSELERTVRAAGYDVAVASDARRLVSEFDADRPVVLIVSDAVDGWPRLLRDLGRSRRPIRVLLVSDLDDRFELVTAVSAGVDGISRPNDRPAAVLGSIDGLCNDSASLPRSLVRHLVGEVRAGRGRLLRLPHGEVHLTEREWQILQLMMQEMNTQQMATELFVAPGTVRSHVSALLGKLGVGSRHEAVSLVEHRGAPRSGHSTREIAGPA